MDKDQILKRLPYSAPFLFVDTLQIINENKVEGTYRFKEELPFYGGHFKDMPITPGVILTECCAQIGLVCLGIYLIGDDLSKEDENLQIAMSSSDMSFYKAVLPNEEVRVCSEKIYFRFSKLKCKVTMYNSKNEVVCRGVLSGMLKAKKYEN
jgi:3-hydroxyacyl-[acyl-carrier-protein] dehydratase